MNFVGADDAHRCAHHDRRGKGAKHPSSSWPTFAAGRQQYLDGFTSPDNWSSTDGPENHELSQQIYLNLKKAGFIETRTIEQFFDPERTCSCLTASSKASARAATPKTSTATTADRAAPCTRLPS